MPATPRESNGAKNSSTATPLHPAAPQKTFTSNIPVPPRFRLHVCGDLAKVLELWNNYCVGKSNTIYECYKFYVRAKEPTEKIKSYASALRTMADTCAFGSLKEEMIKDQLLCGISDSAPCKKLLQEAELILEKCMNYSR